jgi:hypothetical protein
MACIPSRSSAPISVAAQAIDQAYMRALFDYAFEGTERYPGNVDYGCMVGASNGGSFVTSANCGWPDLSRVTLVLVDPGEDRVAIH